MTFPQGSNEGSDPYGSDPYGGGTGGYGYPPGGEPINPFPPGPGGFPPIPPYSPYPPPRPGTNGLAVAALVLSLVCCGPLGLIFGLISMSQIKTSGEQGYGLALAGTIISGITTGLLVLYLLFIGVLGAFG